MIAWQQTQWWFAVVADFLFVAFKSVNEMHSERLLLRLEVAFGAPLFNFDVDLILLLLSVGHSCIVTSVNAVDG